MLELTPDETILIQLMRREGPYAKFSVEKRPTDRNPNGELVRIVVENSYFIKDFEVEKPIIRDIIAPIKN